MNSNFLAINTAGASVEVAMQYDGRQVLLFDGQHRKASASLLQMISQAENELKADRTKLDYIAVCIGPGSFTGIRIGVVTARTFCQALKTKLLPLTYHKVLSYNVDSQKKNIITLSDASNGFLYAAKFDKDHNELAEPFCIKLSEIDAFLSAEQDCTLVCEKTVSEEFDCVVHNSAQCLIKAAKQEYQKSGTKEYILVEPLYVRKPQAVIDLEKKH